MNIHEVKTNLKLPLRKVTLCFLIKDKMVLLAMKKRGFGIGKWNGVGGKPKHNESIEEATIREIQEEIGVKAINIAKYAELDFYFLNKTDLAQQVIVYLCNKWIGDPTESEEMKPKWFSKKDLPFENMWVGDSEWLLKVLDGKKVKAETLFNESGDKIIDRNLWIIDNFDTI